MKIKKTQRVCCQSARLESGRHRFSVLGILSMNGKLSRKIFLGGIFILLTILFIGFIVPTFPCSNVPMFPCSNDALAWTPPASPPPGGNVDAPLNTGDTAQGKTGNLGIGTATPTTNLDVWGNIETTGAITIDGRMTASEFYDGVYYLNPADNTTSLNIAGTITVLGAGDNYFAGSVGIGSSSPGYKLDVNGSLNATSIYIDGALITGGLWTSGSGLIYYNSGNVGIGTTSPDTLLTIANDSWISGKNSAGTGSVNMFKVNSSDEIEVGGTLNIGTIGLSQDSGAVTLVNMPVSSSPTAGTEQSYSFSLDSEPIAKIYAEADGTGGIQNKRLETSEVRAKDSSGLKLYEDGGTGIFVQDGGNVGIGVTSPDAKLEVAGEGIHLDSAGNAYFAIDRSATNTRSRVMYQTAGSTNWYTGLSDSDNTGDGSEFYIGTSDTASGAQLWIETTGNVGIGTTSPQKKLHVWNGDAGADPTWATSDSIIFESNANNYITTFQPTANWGGFLFSEPGTRARGGMQYAGSTYSGSIPADTLIFRSAGSDQMAIDSTGNVGIGTTGPVGKTHIYSGASGQASAHANGDELVLENNGIVGMTFLSPAANSAQILFGQPASSARGIIMYDNSNDKMQFGTTVATADMTIDTNGNVGIGEVSPGAKLSVSGGLAVGSGYDTTVVGDGDLIITGNVGIGTTSPTHKLDVYGGPIYIDTSSETNDKFVATVGYVKSVVGGEGGVGIGTVGQTLRHNGSSWVANSILTNDGTNIGIGVASPQQKLALSSANSKILLGHNAYDTGTMGLEFWHRPDGDVVKQKGAILSVGIGGYGKSDLYFVLDSVTDNNIYNVATDTKMIIKNSGNVGIGTVTPLQEIHVQGDVIGGVYYDLVDSSYYLDAGANTYSYGLNTKGSISSEGSSDNYFAGNVGIGVASPSSELDVNGFIESKGTINNFWSGTRTDPTINKWYKMASCTITSQYDNCYSLLTTVMGSVLEASHSHTIFGIRVSQASAMTSIPLVELFPIENYGSTSLDVKAIVTTDSDSLKVIDIYVFNPKTYAYPKMSQWYGNIEPVEGDEGVLEASLPAGTVYNLADGLYLQTDGDAIFGKNVGIGTTSPDTLLRLDSDGGYIKVTGGGSGAKLAEFTRDVGGTGTITIHSGGNNPEITFFDEDNYYSIGQIDSDNSFRIAESSAIGTTDRLTIDTNGNVGIGTTSPSYKLDVDGVINSQDGQLFMVRNLTDLGTRRNWGFITETAQAGDIALRVSTSNVGAPTTSVMTIKSDGNVGIGTTSPGAKLHVASEDAGTNDIVNIIKIKRTSSGTVANGFGQRLMFEAERADGATINQGGIQTKWIDATSQTSQMEFLTRSGAAWDTTPEMVIDSSGNVGIGTTSPGGILHTNKTSGGSSVLFDSYTDNSNLYVRSGVDAVGGEESAIFLNSNVDKWKIYKASDHSFSIYDYTGSRSILTAQDGGDLSLMPSAGNVGIGTTVPDSKLHIDDGLVSVRKSADSTYQTPIQPYHLTPKGYVDDAIASGDADWAGVGGDPTLAGEIYHTGNVGIGTTDPGDKLTIGSGAITEDNWLTINSGTNANLGSGIQLSRAGTVYGQIRTTNGADTGFIFKSNDQNFIFTKGGTTGGNVGIGTTTPAYKLDVRGEVAVGTAGATNQIHFVAEPTENTDAATKGYIDSAIGVVGGEDDYIGNASPSPHVAGAPLSMGTKTLSGTNFSIPNSGNTYFNSGNVGIGITSPDAPLVVEGTNAVAGQNIYLNSGKAPGVTGDYLTIASRPNTDASARIAGPEIRFITEDAANTNRHTALGLYTAKNGVYKLGAYIDTDGNVGIGTTTPAYKLDVRGEVAVGTVGATNQIHFVATPTETTDAVNKDYVDSAFITGDNDWAGVGGDPTLAGEIYHTGNVGIGTTSPGTKLHIYGSTPILRIEATGASQEAQLHLDAYDNSGSSGIYFTRVSSAAGYYGKIGWTGSTSGDMYFATSSDANPATTKMTIDGPTGNVGIGTTSPEHLLHIKSATATASGQYSSPNSLYISSDSGAGSVGGTILFAADGTTAKNTHASIYSSNTASDSTGSIANLQFATKAAKADTTLTPRMTIQPGGLVGIGTASPDTILHAYTPTVSGSSYTTIDRQADTEVVGFSLATAGTVDWYNYVSADSSRDLVWYDGITKHMTLTTDGYLGIGTTEPDTALEVNGAVTATTFYGDLSGYATSAGSADHATYANSALRATYLGDSFKVTADSLGNLQVDGTGDSYLMGLVGIGTTSPNAPLHVYKNSAWGNTDVEIARFVREADDIEEGISGYIGLHLLDSGQPVDPNEVARIQWEGQNVAEQDGTLSFWTANGGSLAQQMTILDSGNVGIGTTGPGVKLDIDGGAEQVMDVSGGRIMGLNLIPAADSEAIPRKYLHDNFAPITGGAGSAFVQDGNSFGDLATLGTNDDYNLTFETNNARRMTIDNAGLVGIGTSSPAQKLDVRDGQIILTDADVAHGITDWGTTNTYGLLYASSSTEGGLAITGLSDTDNSGTVITGVIGTATPTDTIPAIILKGGKKAASGTGWQAVDAAETVLQLKNYNTNLMTVLGNGNVGIGTTSPSDSLHVNGAGGIRLESSAGTDSAMIPLVRYYRGATQKAYVGYDSNSDTEFTIYNGIGDINLWAASNDILLTGGNVGIGTASPDTILHAYTPTASGSSYTTIDRQADTEVVGFSLATAGTVDWYNYVSADSSRDLVWYDGITKHMTLTTDGYLGIGTNSPDTLLTIANDSWISGKNSAGTGSVNMFKVNSSDEIEVGGTLNIGTIGLTQDSGAVTLVNMPVSSDPGAGTEQSYSFSLDSEPIAKIYAEADGTGGIQNKRFLIPTGNVGIGTATPQDTLHVWGNVTVNGITDCSGSDAVIRTDGTKRLVCGSITGAGGVIGSGTQDYLTKWDSTGTGLVDSNIVYESGGNVGIGTDSPVTKLQIGGTLGSWADNRIALQNTGADTYFTLGEDTNNRAWMYYDQSAKGLGFATRSASTNYLDTLYLHDGNVGIGTTEPDTALEVNGAVTATTFYGDLSGYATSAGSADHATYANSALRAQYLGDSFKVAADSLGNLQVDGTGDSYLMGNVGIGTASPDTILHAYTPTASGSSYTTIDRQAETEVVGFSLATAGTVDWYNYVSADSSRDLVWYDGITKHMTLTTDGYLGIGANYTSPTALLDVNNKFLVSDEQVTMNVPLNLASAGDISIASDLQFTNPTASYIKSYAPLSIESGDSNHNYNLNLKAYGTGKVIIDQDAEVLDDLLVDDALTVVGDVTVDTSTLKVDSTNNNVGIGTATPQDTLHVWGNITVNGIDDCSGSDAIIRTDGTKRLVCGSITGAGGVIGSGTQDYLTKWDSTGTGLVDSNIVYESGGNVGIGTASPNNPLEIYQSVASGVTTALRLSAYKTNDLSSGNAITWFSSVGDDTTLPNSGRIYSAFDANAWTASRLTLGSASGTGTFNDELTLKNGNVGIGTTSPEAPLHVNSISTGADVAIFENDASSAAQFVATGYKITTGLDIGRQIYTVLADGERSLQLQVTNSSNVLGTVMTLQGNSGNVGIGTTEPDTALEVNGAVTATTFYGDLSGYATSAGSADHATYANSALRATYLGDSFKVAADSLGNLQVDGTGDSYLMGNVGIGTASPDTVFHAYTPTASGSSYTTIDRQADTEVNGFSLATAGTVDWYNYVSADSSRDLVWYDGITKHMTLTTDGYLGIGANYTSPTALLDVNNKFLVTNEQVTMNVPLNLASAGDISIASDLQFTNPTASYIKSYAPMYIEAGDPSQNVDLTLRASNDGEVVVDDILRVTNNAFLPSVTMDGDLDMQFYNLNNVNKLYVNTIDPVHEIDGKDYATYVSFYAGGQKMETSGIVKLRSVPHGGRTSQGNEDGNTAQYIIDFSNLEAGSDLWLFWKTIHQDLDKMVVMLTSNFNGRVWYEKIPSSLSLREVSGASDEAISYSQLVIYSDQPGEVSYTLVAPREDYKKWPNLISKK